MDPWRIVGIDCAVDTKKVGVAVGELRADCLVVSEAVQCGSISVVDAVANFVGDASRALIALDAPLGWPAALGRTHRAAQVENRMRILDRLRVNAALSAVRDVIEVHENAFDAAVCTIAGSDFIRGRCRSPRDAGRAVGKR